MRFFIFKVISFIAVFLFVQGAILPWAISNDSMPLWADIIIVTLVLMMWLALIDRLAFHVLRVLRRKDESPEQNQRVP